MESPVPPYRHRTPRGAEAGPPTYSNIISDPVPTYTPPLDHHFHLKNNMKKPWLTLHLIGCPSTSKNVPRFIEGQDVIGSVNLELDQVDAINAVTLSVRGRLLTGAGERDSYTFLDDTHVLWSKGMGDPNDTRRCDGRLQGSYTWPFAFPFPSSISSAGSTPTRIPQTFRDKQCKAGIQYELALRLSRGKLRTDPKIEIPIIYVCKIMPEKPSILRQLAYRDGVPLLGPDSDPEGWFTLPPAMINGRLFNSRSSEVKCTLSIAKPLCYTRGSVIPCIMIMQSSDSQTLDLVSASSAIALHLRRRVRYFEFEDIRDVGMAVWSASRDDAQAAQRQFSGEIHLSRDLAPTSDFAPFAVEYSVVLLPFKTSSFKCANVDPYLVQNVQIATIHAPGPVPRAYTSRPSSRQGGEGHRPKGGGVGLVNVLDDFYWE